jgi:chromosome partitioning protein
VMLSHRAAFTHGVIDGRTAQEFEPDGKAAEEVAGLFKCSCSNIRIQSVQGRDFLPSARRQKPNF